MNVDGDRAAAMIAAAEAEVAGLQQGTEPEVLDAPEADEALRAQLMAEEQTRPGALYARLRRDDATTPRRLSEGNDREGNCRRRARVSA